MPPGGNTPGVFYELRSYIPASPLMIGKETVWNINYIALGKSAYDYPDGFTPEIIKSKLILNFSKPYNSNSEIIISDIVTENQTSLTFTASFNLKFVPDVYGQYTIEFLDGNGSKSKSVWAYGNGGYPFKVQAGSPKFYIPAVGNKNVGDTISISRADSSTPSGYSIEENAYYTIMQDGDQDSWMTIYVPTFDDGTGVDCVVTSIGPNNNFSTTGNSTYMQCVWAKEYYDSIISACTPSQTGMPPGAIMSFASVSVPDGWLLCDGSAVSRTTYAELFAAISTLYGSGDGSTTFNLPNLQGKMVLGESDTYTMAGTGGSETVALTIPQMPAHNHMFTMSMNTAGEHTHNLKLPNSGRDDPGNSNSGSSSNKATVYSSEYVSASGGHQHTITANILNAGSGQPHSNMPPYLVLKYCIKT